MVQGGHGKLGKAGTGRVNKKSAGGQRRKAVKAVKSTRKGSSKVETNNPGIMAATRAINKKNERIIAAKATSGGAHFHLRDIAEKGQSFRECRFTGTGHKRVTSATGGVELLSFLFIHFRKPPLSRSVSVVNVGTLTMSTSCCGFSQLYRFCLPPYPPVQSMHPSMIN